MKGEKVPLHFLFAAKKCRIINIIYELFVNAIDKWKNIAKIVLVSTQRVRVLTTKRLQLF